MKSDQTSAPLPLILALALIVMTAAFPARSDDTLANNVFVEGWREGVIETRYQMNDALAATDIRVEVKGNSVRLRGYVHSNIEKRLAEEMALSVAGIEEVDNQLRLVNPENDKPDGMINNADTSKEYSGSTTDDLSAETTKSTGEQLQDAMITASIKARYLISRYLNPLEIEVTSLEGVVELKGEVATDAEKELAFYIAYNTKGVKDVVNRMSVEAGAS